MALLGFQTDSSVSVMQVEGLMKTPLPMPSANRAGLEGDGQVCGDRQVYGGTMGPLGRRGSWVYDSCFWRFCNPRTSLLA